MRLNQALIMRGVCLSLSLLSAFGSEDPFFLGNVSSVLGDAYTQQARYSEAIAAYRQARNASEGFLGPSQSFGAPPTKDFYAYLALGSRLTELGQPALALSTLNWVIQTHPQAVAPLKLRGKLYEQRGKMPCISH